MLKAIHDDYKQIKPTAIGNDTKRDEACNGNNDVGATMVSLSRIIPIKIPRSNRAWRCQTLPKMTKPKTKKVRNYADLSMI
jgi:hypothetical protein